MNAITPPLARAVTAPPVAARNRNIQRSIESLSLSANLYQCVQYTTPPTMAMDRSALSDSRASPACSGSVIALRNIAEYPS